MKLVIISALFIITLLITSCGNNATTTDSKEIAKEENKDKFNDSALETDARFAVSAADGSMMEVALGQLALTNASAESVKQFGQMMVNDHSKANDELRSMAQLKNISLPVALSEEKQKKYDDFSKKSGAEFDKAYISFMVDDHKKDIESFKKEAEKGTDADIKAWASNKIPALEQHLEMAQAAKDAIKKTN